MTGTGIKRRTFAKLAGAAGFGAATLGGVRAATASTTSETAAEIAAAVAAAQGWKVTGTTVSALASFDSTMKTFMQARNIPAGQLAVTYQGRLVLARGYSWSSDSTLSVQPTSLFRVASLTKSFTAAALVKLVQDGKVTLGTSTSFRPPARPSTRDCPL